MGNVLLGKIFSKRSNIRGVRKMIYDFKRKRRAKLHGMDDVEFVPYFCISEHWYIWSA